ncbi:AAA ATPase-like protein [Methylobacter tundripaludum]|uniref:AAA ATPase-like protein n=1 Tax=Methylobacter tundripaludum TaxID=173365 RepID=A0A2S6H8Y9_9GAMM|nr:AAA family ATPase [Methylobacter tundripaludum]PPK73937.1 AAA ATPase-like protein [Methylobacter tundripaludum]
MINPLFERKLKEFVNRDLELKAFVKMLESDEKPLMIVWGDEGMGKTSLLMRMVHECAALKLRKAEIVWKDTSAHDYLAVMRKIRDDVGLEHFSAFTDLVNFYHETGYQPKLQVTFAVQGDIRVAENLGVSDNSNVGDVAAVMIKDSMIQIPRMDLSVPESERRSRLTNRFIQDLALFLANEPLVVFFDAVEKMSQDTEKWIWDELLDAVRNGILTNIKFVLSGQKQPPENRDWQIFITQAGLKPLGPRDIMNYLKKRVPDLDDANLNNLTTMTLAATKGNPAMVASTVDAFLDLKSSQVYAG